MNRWFAFAYGVLAYLVFLATILYMMGFVGNLWVPKSVDSGSDSDPTAAVLVNTLLVAAFAVQHTVMARPRFKQWWTQFVPKHLERSTYVLIASLLLAFLFWQWRPLPATIWEASGPWPRAILIGLQFAGWFLVFYSSFLINHFDLFGLRQVFLHLRGREYSHLPFVVRSLYRVIRHPLMAGFLIAIWAAPTMTWGHLLLSSLLTIYILVGIRFEERDLVRHLGSAYEEYRSRTPALLPFPKPEALRPQLGSEQAPSSQP